MTWGPQTIVSVVGSGSFGTLVLDALAPFCQVKAYDEDRAASGKTRHTVVLDPKAAAHADVVIFAVPVQRLEASLRAFAPHLRPGTLVVDVCSVKLEPIALLLDCLPEHCDILATHPLFGPQSARTGLRGSRLAFVPVRGGSYHRLAAFLRSRLGLKIIRTTADDHDRGMAYVQGLTHLLARVVLSMDPPPTPLTTRTYELMREMCSLVGNDSPELVDAILSLNPYAGEVLDRFADTARRLRDARAPTVLQPGRRSAGGR